MICVSMNFPEEIASFNASFRAVVMGMARDGAAVRLESVADVREAKKVTGDADINKTLSNGVSYMEESMANLGRPGLHRTFLASRRPWRGAIECRMLGPENVVFAPQTRSVDTKKGWCRCIRKGSVEHLEEGAITPWWRPALHLDSVDHRLDSDFGSGRKWFRVCLHTMAYNRCNSPTRPMYRGDCAGSDCTANLEALEKLPVPSASKSLESRLYEYSFSQLLQVLQAPDLN